MRQWTVYTFGSVLLVSPAAAQDGLLANWVLDAEGELIIALSPLRDDAGTTEAEIATGEIRAEVRLERVLQNGVEVEVRVGGRAQLDHPLRAGFSGRLGDGSVVFDGLAPRGAFTGLTLGGPEEDDPVRAIVDTAFLRIDGGYGELIGGRDIGVARRFHVGSPSVFRRHRIASPAFDTSGIATLLTRNDLTGPSAKISYATPRLLGLRFGGSYTPEANLSGLDRDPDRDVPGIAEPQLENGVEAALNFSRRFRRSGARVRAYSAYARADLEIGPDQTNGPDVDVWSIGAQVEKGWFTLGGDWLTSDNGGGRYRAWSTGMEIAISKLRISGEYGQSSDDLTRTDGQAWSVGVAREYWDRIQIGIGVQQQSLDFDKLSDTQSTGPVIEIALRF